MSDVRAEYIKRGKVRDRYKPNLYSVGYLGDYKLDDEIDKKLKNTWSKMIERCYDKNHRQYKDYGGRGIFVDRSWHNLSTFVKDVKTLINWDKKLNNWNKYSLDKDYYFSNCYSKETCVWITNSDNNLYSKCKPFKSISLNGEEIMWLSQVECAKYFNIKQSAISEVLIGNNKKTKGGLSFEFIGDIYHRYELRQENE